MSKKTTHIESGNVLFGNANQKSKKGFDKAEELKAALSGKNPNIDTNAKSDREIRAEKKARQSSEIRDRSWEEVKGSSRAGDRFDSKQVSRSGDGNGVVGQGMKPSATRPTLFNPDPFSDAKNSEYTDHIINAGKDRRKEDREKSRKNHDFEPSRARTTDEVPASMMGFTPHRTALKPKDMPAPDKEHSEITAQKKKIIDSIRAGEAVAEIYRERDRQKHQEFLKDANDDRKWQDHAAGKIEREFTKEIKKSEKPFNFGNPNEYRESSYKEDLSKIFKSPPNPNEDVKESSIRRDSNQIKSKRKHRSEDRSWEDIENSKQKKF